MKIFVSLILLLQWQISFASLTQADMDRLVKIGEEKSLEFMKAKGYSDAQITESYLNVGEQFISYSNYRHGAIMFARAYDRLPKLKKELALMPLLFCLVKSNDRVGYEKWRKITDQYFTSNPTLFDNKLAAQLAIYKLQTSNQLAEQALNTKELEALKKSRRYTNEISSHDVRIHLLQGNYDNAVKLMSPIDPSAQNLYTGIVKDVAFVLAKKLEKDQRPACERTYRQYPAARNDSMTMNLCKMLLDIQAGQSADKQAFNRFKIIVERDFPESQYLVEVMQKHL